MRYIGGTGTQNSRAVIEGAAIINAGHVEKVNSMIFTYNVNLTHFQSREEEWILLSYCLLNFLKLSW